MRLLALGLVLLLASACGLPTAPDPTAGSFRVIGTVHYYTLEGGFWAVRGDDGVIYDPVNALEPAFQIENLRVMIVISVRSDLAGIHMVGPIVEILQIQRL